MLRRKLTLEDIKPKLVGHWGTVPGQNFIYTHLNRVINKYDLDMIYLSGPGHGGNAMVAHTYLEGSYSEFYPNVGENIEGCVNRNPEISRNLILKIIQCFLKKGRKTLLKLS